MFFVLIFLLLLRLSLVGTVRQTFSLQVTSPPSSVTAFQTFPAANWRWNQALNGDFVPLSTGIPMRLSIPSPGYEGACCPNASCSIGNRSQIAGTVILVRREGCIHNVKFWAADRAGAMAILVISYDNTIYNPATPLGARLPGASVAKVFGEFLLKQISENPDGVWITASIVVSPSPLPSPSARPSPLASPSPNVPAECRQASPLVDNQDTYLYADTSMASYMPMPSCDLVSHTAPQAWFSFALPSRSRVSLQDCHTPGFQTHLTLFRGNCFLLDCVMTVAADGNDTCTDGTPALSAILEKGTYYVMAHGVGTTTGAVGLWLKTNPASTTCTNAIYILPDQGTYTRVDTDSFQFEGPFTCANVSHTAPQAWFMFDLTYDAEVELWNCDDEALETRLSLFVGNCAELTCVTAVEPDGLDSCTDRNPSLTINLTAGTYFVMVHGLLNLTGTVGLQLVAGDDPDPNPSCNDVDHWKDKNDFTCEDYSNRGWCKDWWYGPAWNKHWGTFAVYANADGVAADMACCDCGLAYAPQDTVDCQAGDWGEWSLCTSVPDKGCFRKRTRFILDMPYNGKPCTDLTDQMPCDGCIECPVTQWSNWSCLGRDYEFRTREVTSSNAQLDCPELSAIRDADCDDTPLLTGNMVVQMVGYARYGQLGRGKSRVTSARRYGEAVSLPYKLPITEVVLGGFHSAVIAGGLLYMCGSNQYGQLGLGDGHNRWTFTLMPTPTGGAIRQVALGHFHSAVLLTNGLLFTFGRNDDGQLGINSLFNAYTPIQIVNVQPHPNSVTTMSAPYFSFVALGGVHSMILTSNGSVYAMGSWKNGKLGDPTKLNGEQTVPVQIPFFTGLVVTNVALGYTHSAFITLNHSLYMAGPNDYGQLGFYDNSTIKTSYPVLLQGLTVRQVALGRFHTLILLVNGTVLSTGLNRNGQLGLPQTQNKSLPSAVPFPAGMTFQGVGAGYYFSGALSDSGELWTFGANDRGQTGLGFRVGINGGSDRFGPARVTTSRYTGPLLRIAMGYYHAAVFRQGTGTPTITPTLQMTKTDTESRSHTFTSSSTVSNTASLSADITPTPSFGTCFAPTEDTERLVWKLDTMIPCVSEIPLRQGSDAWYHRSLLLRIGRLSLPLHVTLSYGCPSASCSECGPCNFTFMIGEHGDVELPLLSSPNRSARVLYGIHPPPFVPQPHPRALEDAGGTDLEFIAWRSPTALFLAVVCVLTAAAASFLVASIWLACVMWDARYQCSKWNCNERLAKRWVQMGLAIGAWSLLTGMAWCFALALASYPAPHPLGLFIAGATMSVLGTFLFCGFGAWALREPVQYICRACGDPVSGWRFLGTRFPNPHSPSTCCKAHTAHILCIDCHKPVITGGWQEAPLSRPYHMKCWDLRCITLLELPPAIARWHRADPDITETELVHLLAAAVLHSSDTSVMELLHIHPTLPSKPVGQNDNQTAMHLAARCGNLAILGKLLECEHTSLDPVCAPCQTPPSWCVKGLEDGNDVYVHQPFLLYNNHPCYVGHASGWYMYLFVPENDPEYMASDTKLVKGTAKSWNQTSVANEPRWCVSPYLGSGNLQWHIPFMDDDFDFPVPNSERIHHGYRESFNEMAFQLLTTPTTPIPASRNIKAVAVPHTLSVLEEAVTSEDIGMIHYVRQLYQEQDPGCLRWKYNTGHALWEYYPDRIQTTIQTALQEGVSRITVHAEECGEPALQLDFQQMKQYGKEGAVNIAFTMQTVFQHLDTAGETYKPTSDIDTVPSWNDAVVVFNPASAVTKTWSTEVMRVLVDDGVVHCGSWYLPVKCGGPTLEIIELGRTCMFDAVLHSVVAEMLETTVTRTNFHPSASWRRGSPHCARLDEETGIGARLTDGLDGHQSSRHVRFYSPSYTSNVGTLPFCAKLPNNQVGLHFTLDSITQMAFDAVMKLHAMYRQHSQVKPKYAVAVYVYTYELSHEDEAHSQIYKEMNHAMRYNVQRLIEFWRPLIWEVDVALWSLPCFKGKSYRGINCQVNPSEYAANSIICWNSFSSASQSQEVAEEFAKGAVGTLFLLTSYSARCISAISRFPEEMEVLFPPNTVFQVSSTLFSSSEIGAFYGRVDNIAMLETAGELTQLPSNVPRSIYVGYASFLLHVPMELSHRIIDALGDIGIQSLGAQDVTEDEGVPVELVLDLDKWI